MSKIEKETESLSKARAISKEQRQRLKDLQTTAVNSECSKVRKSLGIDLRKQWVRECRKKMEESAKEDESRLIGKLHV